MKVENIEQAKDLIERIEHVRTVIDRLNSSNVITIGSTGYFSETVQRLEKNEPPLNTKSLYKGSLVETEDNISSRGLSMAICIKGNDVENTLAADFKNKILESAKALLAELEAKLLALD